MILPLIVAARVFLRIFLAFLFSLFLARFTDDDDDDDDDDKEERSTDDDKFAGADVSEAGSDE